LKATVNEPESWKRVISIVIPEEEVRSAFDEKLGKYKKDLKLPGFRPGKVPLSLVKQKYGNAIRAEAIDELVQKSYREACEQNHINPISAAKVNDLKAAEGEPVTFSIETEVDPEIEIKGYQKLKVKPSPKKIKDSDIDEAIKGLQERFAEFKDVDREAKKGDFIKIEYLKVSIDGEERKDIKNPEYPVELGSENRIKDFDKGIIGHRAGETVDITVKFPKDYQDAQIAGKSGEFEVKLVAVQEKQLPEINEEFLKKLGNFADENALREDVRKNLENEEENKAKNEACDKAIETLIKDNPFEVPEARIEQFIDYMYQEALRYNRNEAPLSREDVAARYRDTAVRTIKRHRIIDYISLKENIKATQEEVDSHIQKLAAMYNQPFDTLKQAFRKNGTTVRIRDDIREQKTLDFLIGETAPEAIKE
jgi:trigger factor